MCKNCGDKKHAPKGKAIKKAMEKHQGEMKDKIKSVKYGGKLGKDMKKGIRQSYADGRNSYL